MKRRILEAARRSGALTLAGSWFGRHRLTVLAYHRIADPQEAGFIGLERNVSATPEEFGEQLDWIADRFSIVGLSDVVGAVAGGSLPDRPLLITFDDGYRDNLTTALPMLRDRDLTATIFLAAGLVGTRRLFWWDRIAELFRRAVPGRYELPLLGTVEWEDAVGRESVVDRWVEAAKKKPFDDLEEAAGAVPAVLGVPDADAADGLLLDWEDVAAMAGAGIEFGAHTCDHPILTRVGPDRARREVEESVDAVSQALGVRVTAFAYPNGGRDDFDASVQQLVSDAGVKVAFSLLAGPARASELTASPLALPRVYIHHGDGLTRFAAKVQGLPRLLRSFG